VDSIGENYVKITASVDSTVHGGNYGEFTFGNYGESLALL
jgi:hypothetical protein